MPFAQCFSMHERTRYGRLCDSKGETLSLKLIIEFLQALAESGAIPGSDMTVVAALTKLAYVLAKDCSVETKRMVSF